MFVRFTDRAGKTMALADQEARRFHHQQIRTEHILLGLLKEGGGVGAMALRNIGLNLLDLCAEIEQLAGSGSDKGFRGKSPQATRAQEVIEHAIEEARLLNQDHVGTAQILLGLLRDGNGILARVLTSRGATFQDVQQEVLNLRASGMEDEAIA